MKRFQSLMLLVLLGISFRLMGQNCLQTGESSLESLMLSVSFLASDELQGRYPGTEGEQMAADFIANRFKEAGLDPHFTGSYFQPFVVPKGVEISEETTLKAKGKALKLHVDFYPVRYCGPHHSGVGKAIDAGFGIEAPALQHNDFEGKDFKGKVAIMDVGSPDGVHPHSKFMSHLDLETRLRNLIDKGVVGIVLTDKNESGAPAERFKSLKSLDVPVFYAINAKKARKWAKKGQTIEMKSSIEQFALEAKNVIGQIDNGAERTFIIGAHYDHLGWGEEGSLHKGEKAIHNGADDNASGVAALIEMAQYIIKHPKDFPSNYIFIAFSGEEMGLLGSNFFVNSDEMEKVVQPSLMFNMDMIGRLNKEQLFMVNGTGTSPIFDEIVREINQCYNLRIKTSASGTGPSDHTSFYNLEIPVLHFFTGSHDDYHKPGDDYEKINFEGLKTVLDYILFLLKEAESVKEIPFTSTANEDQSTKTPRFTVTLGIVPDYLYDGEGIKLDGVSAGKPAAKAGLSKGDVVVQMGDQKIKNMQDYMAALSKFKKGDKTKVYYKRENKMAEAKVQF